MRPRSFDRGNGQSLHHTRDACRRFNEAAIFRPRKYQQYARRKPVSGASMRPRSFDRGK